MIKTNQPTLINLSVFNRLNLFNQHVTITTKGIVHTSRGSCPDCGTICNYNGSSNKGRHIFSKSYKSFLRKGQQCCPNCNKTIQVEDPWLDDMIQTFDDYILTQVISLPNALSEYEIVKHLETTISVIISKS